MVEIKVTCGDTTSLPFYVMQCLERLAGQLRGEDAEPDVSFYHTEELLAADLFLMVTRCLENLSSGLNRAAG